MVGAVAAMRRLALTLRCVQNHAAIRRRMASTDIPERERFLVLDGMRGLAALAVITDHVYSPALTGFLASRYLAVDFFFVLSGFVLMHVYGARLARGMSVTAFMQARLSRLYPLYVAGLAIGVLHAVLMTFKGWSDVSWGQLAAGAGFGLFVLPTPPALSPTTDNIYPFDGPAWSLFFELVSNLAFAALFLRLNERVLGAIVAVSAAALAFTAFTYGRVDGGHAWANFAGGFPRVFYGFFAGVLTYGVYRAAKLPALPAWAAFAILLALLALPGEGAVRAPLELFATLIAFPLLVLFSANAHVGGAAGWAAYWAGLLSYGVYILHVPIRDWLNAGLHIVAPDWAPPGALMVALVAGCALAAALVLHVIYDVPARRWLTRWRRRAP
ncbi:MAG: acyltransferase family protein [Hyphomonadaceae bacterium]